MQPHVAIIVVTYNGCADTLECLSSLREITYKNCSVIVVDQDSRDGTPDAVEDGFPEVRVVRSAANDGFAAGNNRGIALALADGADFVLLLNNDTVVDRGFLEPLIAAAASDPEIAVVGSQMLYYDAPEIVWSSGGRMGSMGESVMQRQGRSLSEMADTDFDVFDVDFVVGCGMLLRREAIEQVGVMDERFFLYYEESDLCARMKRAGWRVVTAVGSLLWHKVSRSTGTDSALTLYYMRRNVLLYLEKNSTRSVSARLRALGDALRLATVWIVRGRWRRATILLRATADYLLRRFGRAEWIRS